MLRRLVLLTAIAALVCALSLAWHFPGYFDPLAVSHLDHYAYVGLQHEGYGAFVRYVRLYPRPLGYILLHQCGRLGIEWLFAPMFLASFLHVALLAGYVERVTARAVPLPCYVFFAALLFAHPEWYWGLKFDPLAVFSLTFLLAAFHCWQSYVESRRLAFVVAAAVLIALGSQTKESYFGVLGVFLLIQLIVTPAHRRAAAALLVVASAFVGVALLRTFPWAQTSGAAASDLYFRSFAPMSLIRGLVTIGESLLWPCILAGLLTILFAWRRDRVSFAVSLTAIACAGVSLLPNASLPNHLHSHYAGLAVPFLFVPALLVDRVVPAQRAWWRVGLASACVAVYALLLLQYRPFISGGAAGFFRTQEVIARRLVETLDEMERRGGQSVLVAVPPMPFNPFLRAYFILGELGSRRYWTVIVGDDVPESRQANVRLVHAANPAVVEPYDAFFMIGPDGGLAGSYAGERGMVFARQLQGLGMTPREAERLSARSSAASGAPGFGRPEFFASPNPAPASKTGYGRTRLHWIMPTARTVEIRVGAPNGALFAAGGSAGSAETGDWVTDGVVFFLQDSTKGDPTSPERTLAIVRVAVVGENVKPARR